MRARRVLRLVSTTTAALVLGSLATATVGATATASTGTAGAVRLPGRGSDAAVPLPTVTPIADTVGKGFVVGAPVQNFASLGYTDQEYRFSGKANVYAPSGTWGSDGRWATSVKSTGQPYASRL